VYNKNLHTSGIKENAMSFPSKVFGEKWGGNIFFITKNCRPGCAEK